MKTSIILKGMEFYAYHGVMEQERLVGNYFYIDLILTVNVTKSIQSDDLTQTVNYAEILDTVSQEMQIPSLLLEYLAGRVVKALFYRFDAIHTIDLCISKRTPPMGGKIDKVGFSIVLDRKDLIIIQ